MFISELFDLSQDPRRKTKKVNENAELLNIGDPVIVTGNVQFNGATGEIDGYGKDNRFVIVNLYNHGKHSFHSSDISYNDYADSDDEEARMYDNDPDARNWSMDEADEEPATDLPPQENSRKTQIAGTLPTYQKGKTHLDTHQPTGKTLDFGAGLGGGAAHMGADSYEPFPRPGFQPTYTKSSDIPSDSYHRITNFNVLNVVPQNIRNTIVSEIGRVLAPGGVAIITTRGKDVMSAKGADGPEPMSRLTTIGTYQKGFTTKELMGYVQQVLGQGFEVKPLKLGPAGVLIRKTAQEGEMEEGYNHGFASPNAPRLGRDDEFRNQERNAGLEHESNNIAIAINGKTWKVVPGKGYADSFEERSYLQGMKRWAEKKSASSGKTWTVHLTGAPVSK